MHFLDRANPVDPQRIVVGQTAGMARTGRAPRGRGCLAHPPVVTPGRAGEVLAACSRDGHVVSMSVLEQLAAYRVLDEPRDPPSDALVHLPDSHLARTAARAGPLGVCQAARRVTIAARALCGERARRSRAHGRACAGQRRRSQLASPW